MISGTIHRALLTVLAVILTLSSLLWAHASANRTILLATTTSTRDSGLLDVLLPVFEQTTGYVVKTIAVGTGKALAMGKRGDADVLVTHAPAAEIPLVEAGWLIRRVPFMHNDFVIVGPPADPARVRQAESAADALKRIAAARKTFISRGDNSGTYQKEQALWRTVGNAPHGDWYIESGQGMGATLRIASEKHAYTLTDRSTYLHLQKTLTCTILYAGDPVLQNTYSVMLINPARHPRVNAEGARAFYVWLLGDEARRLIARYGVQQFGQPLFILNPLQ
jgi:tungstate transport system substrate-binding protein